MITFFKFKQQVVRFSVMNTHTRMYTIHADLYYIGVASYLFASVLFDLLCLINALCLDYKYVVLFNECGITNYVSIYHYEL